MTDLTLTFTHAGQERTLAKHNRVRDDAKHGRITPEQASATPWYLRAKLAGKERSFKLPGTEKAALAAARDILNGHRDQPQKFSAWVAEKDAKRGVTLGQLAAEWFAANCPFDGAAPRTTDAADQLRGSVERALKFWQDRRASGVTHNMMAEFTAWRRTHVRAGCEGSRSVDLELAAMSRLCQWAMLTDRIEKNPFGERQRFQRKDTIIHCHEAMPENDDQLHRILTLFFSATIPAPLKRPELGVRVDLDQIIAGGYLAFSALTGLRPGEPALIQRVAPVDKFPGNLASAAPGLIYPMPDGSRRMKVQRLKRGQNPAVLVHPVLADFLDVWNTWLDAYQLTTGPVSKLFPIEQVSVAGRLERACRTLELPRLKPHGFGRAYYVRVRRSQGIDDATIASELGQSSNGDLIRSVYGDPSDPVGGNLHDWLPTTIPAWSQLRATVPANLVKVNFA